MKHKILAENIHVGDYGWHLGHFHFSFADYQDPENGPFGVLEALNDFDLKPNTGFETHPHKEMEIISYCVEGTLAHVDSMGNQNILSRGDLQYLRAGSGVTHSEHNASMDGSLRFLQIWITPSKQGLTPYYCTKPSSVPNPKNPLQRVASGAVVDSAIPLQQDANIFIAELHKQEPLVITNREGRQSYLLCVEGNLAGNGVDLSARDALKLWGAEDLTFTALEKSLFIMIEMAMQASP